MFLCDSTMASSPFQTLLQLCTWWKQQTTLHAAPPDLQNKSHGADPCGRVHEGGAHQPCEGTEWLTPP